eukprot:7382843-Prymnesium_polylepis.1
MGQSLSERSAVKAWSARADAVLLLAVHTRTISPIRSTGLDLIRGSFAHPCVLHHAVPLTDDRTRYHA